MSLKWYLIIISAAGVVFLTMIFSPSDSQPVASIQNVILSKQTVAPRPIRIKIPKIKVDAAIESVALTAGGAMDTPKDYRNTAWFNLGPTPGAIGSAVIAGHYGLRKGKPSVFDNLYKLRKGDKLSVQDSKGKITSFVVQGSRRYAPTADAIGVFFSSDGKAHLNLITCEGTWNKTDKTYSQRLVIFADKE